MVRIDDYLAIEKLTALTGDHPEYLGWVALERVLNQKPYQGRVRIELLSKDNFHSDSLDHYQRKQEVKKVYRSVSYPSAIRRGQ